MPDTSQPDSPTNAAPPRLKPGAERINLALQGGGAHGAFTWGVLDRLLEEERLLEIDGISGTSAGAMNAVVLGLRVITKAAAMAPARRWKFWRAVSALADPLSPIQRGCSRHARATGRSTAPLPS